MFNLRFPLVIIASFLAQFAFAQQAGKPRAQVQIIPFELNKANNIAIKAILNHKDSIILMFHTAANELTLTEEAINRIKSLKFEGADTVKSWGGADNISRFSKRNNLQIGNTKRSNIPIWENKNSGPQTDGKFGLELFADKIIEIDFDKSLIILHSELPSKVKTYEKLQLTFKDEMMFLTANSEINGNQIPNTYLIHSGYAGTILFDDKFTADNKIDGFLKVTDEKSLKDSFGNVLKTKKAILPSFQIGSQQLSNIPVGFFTGSLGRQKLSIIGCDILKRFNIIINADRTLIYLKANHFRNLTYTKS